MIKGLLSKKLSRHELLIKLVKGVSLFTLGNLLGFFSRKSIMKAGTSFRRLGKTRAVKTLPDSFHYDIKKWQKVDPGLVKYSERERIPCGFQSLFGITIDKEDRLYVAGDSGVKLFDRAGKLLRSWHTNRPARSVAVDPTGLVYIGLETLILKYKEDDLLLKWGQQGKEPGEFGLITAMALFEDDLFVADAGNRCVHRFDTEGHFINDIGRKDARNNILGLVVPSPYLDVCVDSDGFLHVSNPGRHKIEKYTFAGRYLSSWGKYGLDIEGFCGCCNPTNFAVTREGRFITSEKGLPRVKIYSPAGELLEVVAGPGVFRDRPAGMDLAVDSERRIYVVDPVEKVIRVFA